MKFIVDNFGGFTIENFFMKNDKRLLKIYKKLLRYFGPQYWWPAETPFEVMVGAILTQNTAWPNVEKAIANLKKENVLSLKNMQRLSLNKLARLIRPSGFYNQKAKKLRNFLNFLSSLYRGRINKIHLIKTKDLRKALLGVSGIGQETADSILLYALGRPAFVVDAYTKRIFSRHGIISPGASYEEIQEIFMSSLPKKIKLYNEYHALIVVTGKKYCKKNIPSCKNCPLRLRQG